jgi:hypothetical protein
LGGLRKGHEDVPIIDWLAIRSPDADRHCPADLRHHGSRLPTLSDGSRVTLREGCPEAIGDRRIA